MNLNTIGLIALALVARLVFISEPEAAGQKSQKPVNQSIPMEFVATGEIRGRVMDPSGAVVPGVRVILRSKGIKRETTTSSDGTFHFDRVPIGSDYQIMFEHAPRGFRIPSQTLSVTVNQTRNINAFLVSSAVPSPTIAPRWSTPTPFPTPIFIPSSTPHPTPFSSPVSSPTPWGSPSPVAGDSEEFKRLLDSLAKGELVFNPPDQMQQGKRERIEVRISAEDIGEAIKEGLKGKGAAKREEVSVSSLMKVILTGNEGAFTIQGFSDETQPVVGKHVAQWDWDVTPLESGTQTLHLQVTAVLRVGNKPDELRDIPVKDKEIQVRVNPWFASKRFVTNNWQWLWTTLVIPAGGLLWGLRRRKARRAGFR